MLSMSASGVPQSRNVQAGRVFCQDIHCFTHGTQEIGSSVAVVVVMAVFFSSCVDAAIRIDANDRISLRRDYMWQLRTSVTYTTRTPLCNDVPSLSDTLPSFVFPPRWFSTAVVLLHAARDGSGSVPFHPAGGTGAPQDPRPH